MRYREFVTEDENTGLGNNIISLLRKSPSVDSPRGSNGQFKNDPDNYHRQARAQFRNWCRRQGLRYVGPNIMNRGGSAIRFYTFVGLMQRECGIRVTGILDVSSMRSFIENSDKFNDSYISSQVEKHISGSTLKVPRGCIDVVKAIENYTDSWTSAYASYHDINGRLDSGIGPGQVEPNTYSEGSGRFDYANFDHVTSLKKLTDLMMEGIQLKMPYADRLANRAQAPTTTLEHFAKAWNFKHYDKAAGVYGQDEPMRPDIQPIRPKVRPTDDEPETTAPVTNTEPDDIEDFKEPEADSPSYWDRMKSGIGKTLRNYLDSEG